MSFSTVLQVSLYEDFDLRRHEKQILSLLDEDRIHHDLYKDLLEAFENGESLFNCHAAYLYELVPKIAALAQGSAFEARGLGEEFLDTWVQVYQNGSLEQSYAIWEQAPAV